MTRTVARQQVVVAAAEHCGQPVGAAVLAVKGDDTDTGSLFRKAVGGRLRTLNLLFQTPTHLRLVTLGGRGGLQPKDEVGAWALGSMTVTVTHAERHAFHTGAGDGTSWFPVHVVRLTDGRTEVVVDVLADPSTTEITDALSAFRTAARTG